MQEKKKVAITTIFEKQCIKDKFQTKIKKQKQKIANKIKGNALNTKIQQYN